MKHHPQHAHASKKGRCRPRCSNASSPTQPGSTAVRTAISWPSRPPVTDSRYASSALHQLKRPADSLAYCRTKTVAMESTGVYWIPLYEILKQRGFAVVLINARDVHNVPGRKRDVKDCAWLRELHSVGLLRASFRPAAAIVTLRAFLRQRRLQFSMMRRPVATT